MERILKLLLLLFHFIVNLYHTNSNLRVRYFMKLQFVFFADLFGSFDFICYLCVHENETPVFRCVSKREMDAPRVAEIIN